MLKAKLKTNMTKKKEQAFRELEKHDYTRGLFVRVPPQQFKKLHIELAEREMTLVEWVLEKIKEI